MSMATYQIMSLSRGLLYDPVDTSSSGKTSRICPGKSANACGLNMALIALCDGPPLSQDAGNGSCNVVLLLVMDGGMI